MRQRSERENGTHQDGWFQTKTHHRSLDARRKHSAAAAFPVYYSSDSTGSFEVL
ncbi:MAG TPA: hypothetical protein VJN89_22430 [Candidatus Acidoferrum sp.]|nr:hypothetical protein [Candidatus Acidoferrum sp.]